jgi:hypothetical protein
MSLSSAVDQCPPFAIVAAGGRVDAADDAATAAGTDGVGGLRCAVFQIGGGAVVCVLEIVGCVVTGSISIGVY